MAKKRDEALLLALAAGATVEQAARHAGCSVRTVYRRQQDGDFRRAIKETRSRMFERALGRLCHASARAAGTLTRLLASSEVAYVRLGAAKSVLELGARLREGQELEERLAAVERRLEERGHDELRAPAAGGRAGTNGRGH